MNALTQLFTIGRDVWYSRNTTLLYKIYVKGAHSRVRGEGGGGRKLSKIQKLQNSALVGTKRSISNLDFQL